MPYYHYTSRQAAQDIICTGLISPGPSGRIYLALILYVIGQGVCLHAVGHTEAWITRPRLAQHA